MYPHRHRPTTRRGEHLDVHAVGKQGAVEIDRGGDVERRQIGLGQTGDDASQVRVADVHGQTGQALAWTASALIFAFVTAIVAGQIMLGRAVPAQR